MADEKMIRVNIVTPDGIIYSHRAKWVDVKTIEGGLTLLPNHMPIVTVLDISQVTVKRSTGDDGENYIAVNGGLLEFRDNVCHIVADTAERARDIDVDRAHKTKEWAEHELFDAQHLHDAIRARRARVVLNKAINRIGVSNRLKK